MLPLIEICVDTLAAARTAARGGANRIEFCSSLSEGGLTPSLGLIEVALATVPIPIHAMVRPRPGDFVYSHEEFSAMERDIDHFKRAGVHGVVLGVLNAGNSVDVRRTRELVERAHPMAVTFHRAFDECADLDWALRQVIATGAHMLLTSGGESSLPLGAARVAELVRRAGSELAIIGGAGVTIENAVELWETTRTAAIHASLRRPLTELQLNNEPNEDSTRPGMYADTQFGILEDDVRALVEKLQTARPSSVSRS